MLQYVIQVNRLNLKKKKQLILQYHTPQKTVKTQIYFLSKLSSLLTQSPALFAALCEINDQGKIIHPIFQNSRVQVWPTLSFTLV